MPKNVRRFGTTPFRDNFKNFLNLFLIFFVILRIFRVSPLCYSASTQKYNHLRVMAPYARKFILYCVA